MPDFADCAHEVLEVVPIVTRVIRTQMRGHRSPALTVPQFRTLIFVESHPGTSLSQVAEYVGITRPSMSVLVDGLVQRRFITRESSKGDRRRVTLNVTGRGKQVIRGARQHTQAYLAEHLDALTEADRETVTQAMCILRSVFAPTQTA